MLRSVFPFWPLLLAPFVGSFLAVLAVRLPQGKGVVLGRSHCPRCGHVLTAVDLIPLISYLAAGRRCRYCRAPIASIYIIMELGAIGVAIWALLALPLDLLWPSCVLGWGLLALAAIDARHFLLPDPVTYPLVATGLFVAYLDDVDDLQQHAIGAVTGFAIFLAIRLVYRHVRGREGLGLGDAKLMAVAGAWVSWEGLPGTVLIAAIASFAWLLLYRRAGRQIALSSALPFGPGLCIGIWLNWLYGPFG